MVTTDQIRELPRKYAIGKRPLSRVLGWGELTYTRLLEGSVPTSQHEEELLRALEEPLTFKLLLDRAHEAQLITDSTYKKSLDAVEGYMSDDETAADTRKVLACAKALCRIAKGDITPHALQVLVYYAQGCSMVTLEKPLFEQMPAASDEGPYYSAVGEWFTSARIAEAAQSEQSLDDLTKQERKLIDAVFQEYGIFSGGKLGEMACAEAPWRKARKRAEESGETAPAITAKSMVKFFNKVAND